MFPASGRPCTKARPCGAGVTALGPAGRARRSRYHQRHFWLIWDGHNRICLCPRQADGQKGIMLRSATERPEHIEAQAKRSARSFHAPATSMNIAGTQRSAENSNRHIHCTREASLEPVIANPE